MRITDDRYTRDRLRLDLALRLIRHEARTCTIRDWTGLSDDRIRKLYKSYVEHAKDARIRRHRGKAPRQAAYFLRNAELRLQAANLASFMCQLGLIAGTERVKAFLQEHRKPQIGFEHACFLRRALERQRELCLDDCAGCGALVVVPPFASRPGACAFCG